MEERKRYGTLSIVATPIGNLEDITLRALKTLREADLVAAEDTRRTIKLLNHYEIKKKLVSFHQHSKAAKYEEILSHLKAGRHVALVSDAGTPLISDPGAELVARCVAEGIAVTSLPGPCAAVTALTLSGLDGPFSFLGFLNTKKAARQKELAQAGQRTAVLYESPGRVLKTLEDINDVFGGETQVCVARELTKLHEEVLRGTAREVLETLSARETLRGEFVLIVHPQAGREEAGKDEVRARLREYLDKGLSKKEIAAAVYEEMNVPKNTAYRMLLDMEKEGQDCEIS